MVQRVETRDSEIRVWRSFLIWFRCATYPSQVFAERDKKYWMSAVCLHTQHVVQIFPFILFTKSSCLRRYGYRARLQYYGICCNRYFKTINLITVFTLTYATGISLIPSITRTSKTIYTICTATMYTWIRRAIIYIIVTQCTIISRITDTDKSIHLILTSSSRGTRVSSAVISVCRKVEHKNKWKITTMSQNDACTMHDSCNKCVLHNN